MNMKKTQRGFAYYEFKDANGESCSLQITQSQVRDLLPILQRFVETGEIYE